MIQEVFSIKLPVGEKLKLMRHRFEGTEPHTKRISIITGIHGDELEGQYVAYLLGKWLREHKDVLRGTVDIYPAVNSLGIDAIKRSIPFYEVDLNRQFPGSDSDFMPSQFADGIVRAIAGSDIAIDIHASNIFLREIPQVRIAKTYAKTLMPLARLLNIDFIWVHDAVTVLESTLAHALNTIGVQTLVVEMGVGMRITKQYGQNLFEGILALLAHEGVITVPIEQNQKTPICSDEGEVCYLNAPAPGLFVPSIDHCQVLKRGDSIGQILSPLAGTIIADITAPIDGILFTLREYPVVYEGSLLARIFGGNA